MSHTAQIQIQIKDLEALTRAFANFGWTLQEKSKIRTYSSDPAKNTVYDYAFINPSTGYDLGVNKQGDEYKLFGDFFGGSIAKSLGNNVQQLRQQYTFEVVKKYAEEQDLEYEVETLANGTKEVTILD